MAGGDILYTCNIPLRDVPLSRLFRQYLDVPVLLENDANCAAVGEWLCGAGRGTQQFIVVTLGTGVGGGLILNGKLYSGSGMVGEVGHMVIQHGGAPCNCGRRGCWEAYASATGLIRMTREAMEAHPESLLHTVAAQNGCVEGRTAFDAAVQGDETALGLCRDYVSYLAAGVTNLINILQPEAVAIGGGVAAAPDRLLLTPLREIVERECYPRHTGQLPRIVRAELGNDARHHWRGASQAGNLIAGGPDMDWYQELDKWTEAYLPDLEVRAEEPMARHTSFRIGGPAGGWPAGVGGAAGAAV